MHASPPMVRNSERGTFKECQWRWYHEWVLGLRGDRVPTWAWFGTAMHVALSVRYPVGLRRGGVGDVLDAFEEAVAGETRRMYLEGREADEQEVVDGITLGKAMLRGYMQRYGRDQAWEVVHNEQPFQIDVPNPRTGEVMAVMCGTWDLVVWDRVDKVYRVVDHKTRRSFPQMWTFYDINDQAGTYLWVAPEVLRHKGIFGPKDHLDGIVFNCLRKAMPDERPIDADGNALNKNGTVSARQPKALFYRYTSHRSPQERVRQSRHVLNEVRQMHRVRNRPGALTKHPTEECPRCPLFDICTLDEQDPQEARSYARRLFVHTDPYRDHREDMRAKQGVQVTAEGVMGVVR